MDREAFFDIASQPGFSNEMVFQGTTVHKDPERTFSVEGVEGLTDQFHNWLMAKILGRSQEVGPPHEIEIHVSVKWKAQPEALIMEPYYRMTFDPSKVEEFTTIDGARRWQSPLRQEKDGE